MPGKTTASLPSYTDLVRDKGAIRHVEAFAAKLRRRQIIGAYAVASETARVLRVVVSGARFSSADELAQQVKSVGRRLQEAQPLEQTVANIVRRVLHLLREEARAAELPVSSSSAPPTVISLSDNFSKLEVSLPFSSDGSASAAASPAPAVPPSTEATSSDAFPLARRPSPRPMQERSYSFSSFSIGDLVSAGAGTSSSAATTPSSAIVSGFSFGNFAGTQGSVSLGKVAEENEAEAGDEEDEDEGGEEDEGEEDVMEKAGGKTGKGLEKKSGLAAVHELKPLLIQAIQELIDELETVYFNVARNAKDHVHSGEIILTLGRSRTVESFLKAAKKDRDFTVVVAETAPSYTGVQTARSLHAAGIRTLLVPDSSLFAVMPRVSKVLLGTHSILANGGLLSFAGSLPAAVAARAHCTPVVVVAGQFKVCPEWGWVGRGGGGNEGAVELGGPSSIMRFDEAELVRTVQTLNPEWDYVRPDLVDVFITNLGEHPPSYIYRLIKESYDEADMKL